MKHKITTYKELKRRFNNTFYWTHEGNESYTKSFDRAILYSMKNNDCIKFKRDITDEMINL